MKRIKTNATKKGGKVENRAIELEVVKTIDNPMDEYETLDEKEQGINSPCRRIYPGVG